MPYIKNIEHEKVVDLAGEVQYMPGQVVSKTLELMIPKVMPW